MDSTRCTSKFNSDITASRIATIVISFLHINTKKYTYCNTDEQQIVEEYCLEYEYYLDFHTIIP